MAKHGVPVVVETHPHNLPILSQNLGGTAAFSIMLYSPLSVLPPHAGSVADFGILFKGTPQKTARSIEWLSRTTLEQATTTLAKSLGGSDLSTTDSTVVAVLFKKYLWNTLGFSTDKDGVWIEPRVPVYDVVLNTKQPRAALQSLATALKSTSSGNGLPVSIITKLAFPGAETALCRMLVDFRVDYGRPLPDGQAYDRIAADLVRTRTGRTSVSTMASLSPSEASVEGSEHQPDSPVATTSSVSTSSNPGSRMELDYGRRQLEGDVFQILEKGLAAEANKRFAKFGSPIHISQADFSAATGTFRIRSPGVYVITEDIVFWPRMSEFRPIDKAGNEELILRWEPSDDMRRDSSAYPDGSGEEGEGGYGLGWFAAITVECSDVTIDFQNHKVEMAAPYRYTQRFFSLVTLNNQLFPPGYGPVGTVCGNKMEVATHVTIRNGRFGRTSHYSIFGNENKNLLIEDCLFEDFEVAAIQLNGAENVVIRNCEILQNCTKVFVNSAWSSLWALDRPMLTSLFQPSPNDNSTPMGDMKINLRRKDGSVTQCSGWDLWFPLQRKINNVVQFLENLGNTDPTLDQIQHFLSGDSDLDIEDETQQGDIDLDGTNKVDLTFCLNETGCTEETASGIVLNKTGMATQGFSLAKPTCNSALPHNHKINMTSTKPAAGNVRILIKNVSVRRVASQVKEVVGIGSGVEWNAGGSSSCHYGGGEHVATGPLGDLFRIQDALHTHNCPINQVSNWSYVGTPLCDAQLWLSIYGSRPWYGGGGSHVRHSRIPHHIAQWAASENGQLTSIVHGGQSRVTVPQDSTSSSTINVGEEMVTSTIRAGSVERKSSNCWWKPKGSPAQALYFVTNSTAMSHTQKGVHGIRIDRGTAIRMTRVQIEDIYNNGAPGSNWGGAYMHGNPQQSIPGYNGNHARGLLLSSCDDVGIDHLTVRNVTSRTGYAVGVEVMGNSSAVKLAHVLVAGINTQGGEEVKGPSWQPMAVDLHVWNQDSIVDSSNVQGRVAVDALYKARAPM
eukprot:TRINITY_DN9803_c0_g1_i1.p1 TRINITY_DN9803_c0_g1~~TRINITY_DN9803_c0_g1_i1.p1  ORF type:complete len:1056 (-),score=78.21 TRINITY_DN9803_c0_g1_i1:164-3202(-)